MMDEDEDEEMPEMPQPADGASETDDDTMKGNAEPSDHNDHTGINGIGRTT